MALKIPFTTQSGKKNQARLITSFIHHKAWPSINAAASCTDVQTKQGGSQADEPPGGCGHDELCSVCQAEIWRFE
jgi:hypothetical protein